MVICLAAALTFVGCSPSSSSSSTAPSSPVALSITPGTDLLTVAGQQQYTLRAVSVDGIDQEVRGVWSSDSNVATVVGGLVRGVAPGN